MRAPEILFWIIIGVLVGALLILIANEILINVLKVNVRFESTGKIEDCSSYSTSDICESKGCKWCPKCSDYRVNDWGEDKCINPQTICDYTCTEGCGAPATCGACEKWDSVECGCVPAPCP